MIEIVASIFLWIGTAFIVVATIGVLRFQDVYLRLQSSSKALTFGLGNLLLGAALLDGSMDVLAKAGLIIIFQFVTSPIAAQLIARASVRMGVRPKKAYRILTRDGVFDSKSLP